LVGQLLICVHRWDTDYLQRGLSWFLWAFAGSCRDWPPKLHPVSTIVAKSWNPKSTTPVYTWRRLPWSELDVMFQRIGKAVFCQRTRIHVTYGFLRIWTAWSY
jgi:hypothetical protein